MNLHVCACIYLIKKKKKEIKLTERVRGNVCDVTFP